MAISTQEVIAGRLTKAELDFIQAAEEVIDKELGDLYDPLSQPEISISAIDVYERNKRNGISAIPTSLALAELEERYRRSGWEVTSYLYRGHRMIKFSCLLGL